MSKEFPHWRGNERVDGVRVCPLLDEYEAWAVPEEYHSTWMVSTGDESRDIISCPCCAGMIRTKRAAMLIADKLRPVAGGSA